MIEAIVYLVSSFWLGALHAATPGHGKTIAAAYIVGARGRPADAVVLGIFVTLSHTAGIVLVAVLASLGAAWAVPARVEAYLAVATGLVVVGVALGMVRNQWAVLFPREPGHDQPHEHEHAVAEMRPNWAILAGLGVAGGLLPDPGALAILLAALASGKVILGLFTVVVFSLGFAAVLVVVGLVAARLGQLVLTWLEARWLLWLQLGTALLILVVGLVLTATAWRTLARLT